MVVMKNYFDQINQKLKKQIEIEEILIVDNSHKHRGHKFFSAEKYHLHLKIKSLYLNSISRVNAQKLIMKILQEDLKKKIHALEISIEQ
jgi:BolA family transcriptional regulator, general stress-responsive regulator